ncbi:MAG TPA: DUF3341 domain-containing protein [Burkholderiaceae bacterium]|nr:DUF3341 domain-containing protein [Burkholderiaceae bacterium]
MIGTIQKLLFPPPPKFYGVMGIYYYVDDAAKAVTSLRQAGHKHLRVYSPVPHHEIEAALEQGPSLVRWVTAVGGFLGCTGGFALCWYTIYTWPMVIGGKELYSVPPFTILGYESMILLAGLSNLFGMLALARLPEIRATAPYDPRFQEDRIGIWVACPPDKAAPIEQTMKGHGAEEVQVHA